MVTCRRRLTAVLDIRNYKGYNNQHMEKLGRLRQIDAVNSIVRFQKTGWFPLLLGVLCVVSCILGFDIAVFYIFTVIGLFTILINDDIKTALPVLIFPYFATHNRVENPSLDYYMNGFSTGELIQMSILGGLLVAALIIRITADGKLKSIFTKKIALTGSICVIFAALLLNGIVAALSSNDPLRNLGYNIGSGMLLFVCLFGFYYIFTHALKNDKNNIIYLCRIMATLGAVIFAEVLITSIIGLANGTFLREDSFFIFRESLILGWGTPDVIAGMLLLCLPCMLYLTMTHRLPVFSYGLAVLYLAAIIVTQSRSAIYVAYLVMVLGTVFCCIKGRNRIFCRYLVVALAGIAMVLFSILGEKSGSFFIRILALDQNWFVAGTETVWQFWTGGWHEFAMQPVFGAGFAHALPGGGLAGSMYYNMYFNMIVQIAACTGLIGLFGAVYHAGQVVVLFLRRISKERFFIGFAIATMVLSSMISNYIFYPQFAVLYALLIAFAERDSDFCREKALAEHKDMTAPGGARKPRVVFTFVEAGLGHIMSVRPVADAFEKKYGDRVDVVRSDFFTETGEKELADMQEFFGGTVRKQNEIRGFGSFMMLAAKLFGEWISHTMTMEWTPTYRKAAKQGAAHIDRINADLVFTTHWATAYYAGKSKHRPFVITLCPDMKSNIMFRIDSNYLLISTKEGYDDLLRIRRYNENNVKLVPRPIRGAAYGYSGKKDALREELGIDKDAFVVLIADGGYGLAKMLNVTKKLAASRKKMTLIPVAGLSKEIYAELCKIKPSPSIDFRPYGFTEDILKLEAAADLFVGKSGACLSSETYFYGVPQIITNVATPIERDIMKYCRDTLKSAIYQPNENKAVALVEHFADNRGELSKYAENASKHEPFGEEEIIDLIYRVLEKQGKVGSFYDDYGETVEPPPPPAFPKLYWMRIARQLRRRRKEHQAAKQNTDDKTGAGN